MIKQEIEQIKSRLDAIEAKLESPDWIQAQRAKINGAKRSERKSAAARENGKLGGRPRKTSS